MSPAVGGVRSTAAETVGAARRLAAFLGDPRLPAGPLTFAQAVADDRAERFPEESLGRLREWGYAAHQVPVELGGRLGALEELLALGRVVARRDPAVAVVANSPVASAMPVWLAGSPRQRAEVAASVLSGGRVALALTEPDHGADLLGSEVVARRTGEGYVLDGTKWPINNVRLARHLVALVRDPERTGLRSLSLLLVDVERLDPASYELLDKVPTHGVRGVDIAGIRFTGAFVPADACVGRPGRGLELTAQALLVTRTLVPGLSLGVLDTAIDCVLDFVRDRGLYGAAALDIPYVQDELAAALLDLRVAEAVTGACLRALHLLPELAPVSSAVAKYLVPHLVEARMNRLATVLGARYYLREGHWSGIFEKLLRDVRLFALFDGSEPVVLSALAAQAPVLTEGDGQQADVEGLFALGTAVPPLSFDTRTFATVADADPVTAGLEGMCARLERESDQLTGAVKLLRDAGRELLARAEEAVDPRGEAGQRLGEQYARVFGALCWAGVGLAGAGAGAGVDAAAVPPDRLAAGLTSLLAPGTRMPRATATSLLAEHAEHAEGAERLDAAPEPV